jgi:hypothetical protein
MHKIWSLVQHPGLELRSPKNFLLQGGGNVVLVHLKTWCVSHLSARVLNYAMRVLAVLAISAVLTGAVALLPCIPTRNFRTPIHAYSYIRFCKLAMSCDQLDQLLPAIDQINHPTANPFRLQGDKLADAVVAQRQLLVGKDVLTTIQQAAASTAQQPNTLQISSKALLDQCSSPSWVQWDSVARGQRVFVNNALACRYYKLLDKHAHQPHCNARSILLCCF